MHPILLTLPISGREGALYIARDLKAPRPLYGHVREWPHDSG
jgi:hypothetical protein